jgi:hypothetical protein
VGGVLVAGTLITVIIDVSFEMSLAVAAIVGLSIALVKAGFVIFIFMHYKWDKKLIMITWTMILTFVFFAGMMGLIMWAEGDIPRWGRKEVPIVWPVLASLLGLILPASFAMFTVKILSQPIANESEKVPKPKAKRVARKKKLSQPIAVESEKDPKPKAKQATRRKKQD